MNEQLLKQRIDEVLHYIWDPIGVSVAPMARDEYQSYVDPVLRMVLDDKPEQEIASYLTQITTELMEVEPYPDHDTNVAAQLLELGRLFREGSLI